MKVLLFNGSNKAKGCTYTALKVIADVLEEEGIETEIISLGANAIADCTGCGYCSKNEGCVMKNDSINQWIEKAREADGFIFGTPVYYAHPSGRILSALDRMFYAGGDAFQFKPGAVIASARRGGTTASLDTLSKYFGIAQMPMISSSYWNMVHGKTPEETVQDLEGMQTMRNLGHNMAWILKCIAQGKENGVDTPKNKIDIRTNFIR